MFLNYGFNKYSNSLFYSYIDKNSKLVSKWVKLKKEDLYKWEYCTEFEKDATSWDLRPLKKNYKNFELDLWKRSSSDLHRLIELLYSNMENEDDVFSTDFDKMYFIDIETEILDNDSNKPKNPLARILSISVVTNDEKVIVLGLKPLSDEEILEMETGLNSYFGDYGTDFKIKYKQFEDEFSLLEFYVNVLMTKMKIQTGWFFNGFDLPYILARCERLGIETKNATGRLIKTLPPNLMQNMGDMFYYLPTKFIAVDYLELCFLYEKTVNMKISKKLDYVAENILGIGKIKLPSGFMEMYNNDYKNYIFYNIVDSALVMMIDRYSKCFLTHIGKMKTCKCTVYDAFKDTKMLQHILIYYFNKENKFVPCDAFMLKKKNESSEFIGGWVFDGKKQFENDCVSFDFSSLYPSCIFQWNISPDTLIYRKEDVQDEDVVKNNIRTPWGAVYSKERVGIMTKIFENFYKNRKKEQFEGLEYQKMCLDIKNELNNRGIKV